MKKAILTKKAPLPIGPYNQAINFNEMLFVSGQIPLDPITNKLASRTNNYLSTTKNILLKQDER